ncbi:MAG: carboxymuconolactone decarboxylase family protein [Gammaproteobacteria bacterium]|nr:carboxymuconolactone decarboxylase family protein [Gammaproteobacteria bacterium]
MTDYQKATAMARIPLVEADSAPPQVRAQYQQMQDLGFPLFNVFKVFGANAGILEGFIHIAKTLYGNPKLAPRYRELAYLRASQINACHY